MGGGENEITISAILNTTGFQKGTKQLEKAIRGLSMSAKHLAGTLIGVGSAYGILSKAVSAFMAQNKQLSANMQSVWTAFGNLLGPIITQVINWITTAVAYFIEFLRLLGITTKTAKEASKAAGGAGGALQKTLAGFDELNKLSKGGGGGANGSLPNTDPVKWMEDLANALKNKMWDEAADIIIAKMNDIIAGFKKKAAELGDLLSDWIAGFTHILARVIKEVNWAGIGEGIAEFLNNAFREVDGKELGTILVGKIIIAMQVVAGFLETLDWKQLAIKVSDIIIGVFESLGESIAKIDWKKIGDGIKTFFENIDWEGIKESIFGFLKTAWEAALDLLWGLLAGESGEEPPIVASLRRLGEAVGEVARAIEDKKPEIQAFVDWILNSALPGIIDDITDALSDLAGLLSGDIGLSEVSDGFWRVAAALGAVVAIQLAPLISNIVSLASGFLSTAAAAPGAAAGIGGVSSALSALGTVAGVAALAYAASVGQQMESSYELDRTMGDTGNQALDLATAYDQLEQRIWAIDAPATQVASDILAQEDASKQLADALGITTDELEAMRRTDEGLISMTQVVEKLLGDTASASDDLGSAAQTASSGLDDMSVSAYDASGGVGDLSRELDGLDYEMGSVSGEAYGWGSDLLVNFWNGIASNLSQFWENVRGVAQGVRDFLGFSEPKKGPLSDFHTFAPDMMKLYAEGIESNKKKVLGAVNDLAGGIDAAMENGDYSIDIDASMSNFADKIVDGFSDLIERLQAIADNVMFTMPAMAGGGVVPYSVGGGGFGVPGAGGGTDVSASIETLNGLMVEFMDEIRNMKWVAKFGKVEAVVEEITRVQKQNERARG